VCLGKEESMMWGKRVLALVTLFLLVAGLVWAQNHTDAMYLKGRVKELPRKKLGKLDVSDAEVLQFTWQKGTWKVPFAHIKTVYVSLSRRPEVLLARKRKLLLSLNLTDEQGTTRNCVFFLPRGSTREFIRELETKTGRGVIYESAEARKAIEARQ
jgi:hypothetical protein